MTNIPLTSSQTVGPFFAPALLREDAIRNVLTQPETSGERIHIEGRVLDGDGLPVLMPWSRSASKCVWQV